MGPVVRLALFSELESLRCPKRHGVVLNTRVALPAGRRLQGV